MKQTKFKLLISDHDTHLFRAAKMVQEDYIVVTNKRTEESREFKNKTEFYGHWKQKAGGWLNEANTLLGVDVSPDDFDIEECVRLNPEIDNHLEEAEKNFDFTVGHTKKLADCEDYRLVIGGDENFRYDLAQELPYKGDRKEKPLLFGELRDLIVSKYKSKVIIAEGREADDYLSEVGIKNFTHFNRTGKWLYLLSYIDKDIKMVVSPHINPDKAKDGIVYNPPLDAARCYAKQLLIGDVSVDNIPSLPNLSAEFREKYGLRKGNGVGDVTAEKLLEPCTTPKELFSLVVEAYKDYYGGDEVHVFDNFRGDTLKWTWREYIVNRAKLLWMYRSQDYDYDILRDTFEPLGVEF